MHKIQKNLRNSILLYKFVKFGVNKRFWHYNFPFSRSLRVWKMRIEWQFCTRDEVEGVNLSRDSQFFEWDDSVKTEIYSGKTLRPANLSNEYNRMLFLIFRFPENKMDNSQNGYSSVEKTGKIKKIQILQLPELILL